MNRITTENVAAAIRKVSSMSLPQKEELAEEIHRDPPHLLASCVVQPNLGAHLNDVEFLLNILLVCYQAMKESGLRWPMITEDEQQRQMQRWIGVLDFSEHALSNGASDNARQQYVDQYPERPLLAFMRIFTTAHRDSVLFGARNWGASRFRRRRMPPHMPLSRDGCPWTATDVDGHGQGISLTRFRAISRDSFIGEDVLGHP